ncbi:MAG TPA: YeeE/YedE thiosulfate transporter family protein [Thermoanaerobaculia bacterium]
MIFPFESLTHASRELGLVAAVLIGIGFGFVLERAGFGRAPKLAAQFYLRDMTVFKVMFSAIVTAMLGLVIASSLGLANLREISESIASWTYVWPMLFGGLLLGVGFIVSGYCPGTSIVASASGNIDGIFAFGGVVVGTFVYSELLQIPAFHHFHMSGEKGAWFLYDLVHVRPQLIAAVIALAALLAFVGAEKVERWISGASANAAPPHRKIAFATIGTVAIAAVVAIALPASAPASTPRNATITASELSQRVVEAPWSIRIVDTRAKAAERVRGSEVLDANAIAELPDDGRTLVIVGDARHMPRHARVLAGGIGAWTRDPLARALATGAPPPPPSAPAAGGAFTKPKKKGGGCSA